MRSEFERVIQWERFQEYQFLNGVWLKGKIADQRYANNFGLQWNTFQTTQFDSKTGSQATANRLFGCSGWHPSSLKNKLVLEVGSGAGRFTEVLLKHGAYVVSTDISNAVFANARNNSSDRLLLIREDIGNLPLVEKGFDYVLGYGVMQHTPKPEESYLSCVRRVKEDGLCSFDHYRKIIWPRPMHLPKYIWRPITRRVDPELLLKLIRWYIPIYFPIDETLRKIPKIGNTLRGIIPIPCYNYSGSADTSNDKHYLLELAILDTFDALSARYDIPWNIGKLYHLACKLNVKSFHLGFGGNGLVLNTFGNCNEVIR